MVGGNGRFLGGAAGVESRLQLKTYMYSSVLGCARDSTHPYPRVVCGRVVDKQALTCPLSTTNVDLGNRVVALRGVATCWLLRRRRRLPFWVRPWNVGWTHRVYISQKRACTGTLGEPSAHSSGTTTPPAHPRPHSRRRASIRRRATDEAVVSLGLVPGGGV